MERDTTDIGSNMYLGTTLDHSIPRELWSLHVGPVEGNMVLWKHSMCKLLYVSDLKMTGAFVVGNLFICHIKWNKASLGQWLCQNETLYSMCVYVMRQTLPLGQRSRDQER